MGEWQDKWHADWVQDRPKAMETLYEPRSPEKNSDSPHYSFKIERLDVLQIIILGLATRTSDFCMGHFCK